jgi:hypothetical protein
LRTRENRFLPIRLRVPVERAENLPIQLPQIPFVPIFHTRKARCRKILYLLFIIFICTEARVMRISRSVSALLALLFLTLTGSAARAQTIQSFRLVQNQSGWVLTANHLFWTDNLGAQWTEITPSASAAIAAVTFRTDGSGYLLETLSGQSSLTLARTSDNGAHWTTAALPSPFDSAQIFSGHASIAFPDAQHGFLMLGVQSGSAFRPGVLLRTLNGGQSWTIAPAPPIGGDITFLDAAHGFTGPGPAGDELFATADAGLTWQRAVLSAPIALAAISSTITQPAFSDATHGALLRTFATSPSTLVHYQTADAGITWTSTPAAAGSTLNPTDFIAVRSGTCTVNSCTQSTTLRSTTDGGLSQLAVAPLPGLATETTSPSPLSSTVYSTSGVMGFDACSLPTNAQMTDWITNSPYRVAGIYIGGANFACKSGLGSLTPAYVAAILAQGWQMNPIWVGPQAPGSTCTSCSAFGSTPSAAMSQGVTEADSAIAAMQALGLNQGSTIVYDMEAYDTTTASNVTAAINFIEGWNTELHAQGYLAAVYSSHPEFTSWYPPTLTPSMDIIWFAYFFSSGVPCGTTCQTVFPTQSSFDISPNYWVNNHRARQTSSAFNSTYGTTTINIDEDWIDAAFVTATTNTLTVTKTGSGTVASTTITNPNSDVSNYTAINCGATCSATFAPTDTVTITATPATNYAFSSWTGCTSVSGTTCTVTVTTAKAVVAAFVQNYTLTVTKAGSGTGTVTSADSSINCGTTCSATYTGTTTETLTAAATSGSTFAGWSGCATATGTTCVVSVTGAIAVTATFTGPVTLTVAKAGTGTGTVASTDSNINCGAACSYTYPYNTTVTLNAAPASGSTFTGWNGGGCAGTGACITTLTAATTITASFAGPVTLTVVASGSGTITSTDSKINCGATCSASYPYNTSVTLNAVPASGYAFTGWSGGGCTGTAACTTTLTTSTTVTAAFAAAAFTTTISPTTLSITKGTTGTETLSIVTTNNWTGTFTNFACTGLPATVTCSFSPTSLTSTSNTTLQTVVTISVPSTISQLQTGPSKIFFAGLILPSILLPFALRRRKLPRARLILLALFALTTLGLAPLLTGCGGSSTPAANTTPIFSGSGIITFTSTQTGGAAVSNSTTFTLTIPRT